MASNYWPKDGIVIEFSSILITLIVIIALAVRLQQSIGVKNSEKSTEEVVVAFFHLHCDSGGGGERVLWVIIDALLQDESLSSKLKVCIYCAKAVQDKSQMLRGVENNFRINAEKHSSKISFVHIQSATLLDAEWYVSPFFA
jgi:ALG11 mannosyltransferase N-terminus